MIMLSILRLKINSKAISDNIDFSLCSTKLMNYLSESKTDYKPMLSFATACEVFVNKRKTRIVKVPEFETKLMSFGITILLSFGVS